jgi:hypothetical protein
MKRLLPIVLVLLALSACATTARPEGIVERWLLALNQGSAGEPQRYARNEISEQVLLRWRDRDPGQLDAIEVGRADRLQRFAPGIGYDVPFRVAYVEGGELEGWVTVIRVRGSFRVRGLEVDMPLLAGTLPSQGGLPLTSVSTAMWFAAIAVGLGLALAGEASMRLIRRGRD